MSGLAVTSGVIVWGVSIASEEWPGVGETTNGADGPEDADMVARVGRLSAGQLDCLRLVDQHLSSKEIAAELDISPHTVDQRIRGALHILGVDRRNQAARIIAQYGGEYQRLIHQSPHIESHSFPGHPETAVRPQ